MSDQAWIVHQTAGRLRLRLPQRRKDPAYLEALAAAATELPGIVAAQANPVTGSLLLLYEEGEADSFADALDRLVDAHDIVLGFGAPPLPPVRPALERGLAGIDSYLVHLSQQSTDLRSLGVLLLLALSLVQLGRGQVLAPATSLLWYALDLLRDPSGRLPGDGSGD
jgi:hypothetical protein